MPAEELNHSLDTKYTHVDLSDEQDDLIESPVRPKSKELIQAQIAAFTAEKLYHDVSGSEYLLDELASLSAAANPADGVYRDPTALEIKRSPDGAVPKLVATSIEYTQFLREVGGANYEPIARREELLSNFKHFEEAVSAIIDRTPTIDARKLDPDKVGSGTFAEGFTVQYAGKDYVARIPRRYDHELNDFTTRLDPHDVDGQIQNCLLGSGIPHLEQIVAASYELGTTISEKMPGINLEGLDAITLAKITDEQLIALIETTQQAHNAKILLDLMPGNFLYDPVVGFGVIDYETFHPIFGGQQDIADVVIWLGKTLEKVQARSAPTLATDLERTTYGERLIKICEGKLQLDQADKVRLKLEAF
jgi:hypothetical protein